MVTAATTAKMVSAHPTIALRASSPLAVIASAIVVTVGVQIADPLIGLAITLVILRITWQSWRTVRGHKHDH